MYYVVLCLANVKINTLLAYFYGIFPKKPYSNVSRFILPRMCTSDSNLTTLSDVYRLFTSIGYPVIQAVCLIAKLGCIANMIGRLLDLHIVESRPCNQAGKRRGFLIFDLMFTSHFTFSYVFIL